MPSTLETGHTKNFANFKTIVTYCKGFGEDYKPNNALITIAALDAIIVAGTQAFKSVSDTGTIFTNVTNARILAFSNVDAISTRVLNAFSSSGIDEQYTKKAVTINNKIQGRRATPIDNTPPPTDPNAKAAKKNSVSQLSYDNKAQNFGEFIIYVTSHSEYDPNKAELKLAALNTKKTLLDTTNKAVVDSTKPFEDAIIARDTILYAPKTGIVDLVKEIKKYVLSVYGSKNPQYRQISGIAFRKQAKK